MGSFLGVGISLGVLAGLWTQASIQLQLLTWVAFVAWASYFAGGGGRDGFTHGPAANLSGALWGWGASLFLHHAAWTGAVAVAVTVVAFILCVQAAVPLLAFIPGAFAGTAVFFGTSFDLSGTLIGLACGAGLGWGSDLLARRIQTMIDGPATVPTPS